MISAEKFLPRRANIDAFGSGGFRFGGMSHLGSLLITPSGMRAWPVTSFDDTTSESFAQVISEKSEIDFLLIGCGASLRRLPLHITRALEGNGFQFDCMTTSAAIHSYNVTLAENRRVAAVLIAVEHAHGR